MSVIRSTIPSTVQVDDFAKIGDNVVIGDFTRVCSFTNLYHCKIGGNCLIGTFTEVQSNVTIESNTRIQSHSFICSNTHIGSHCFISHNFTSCNDNFKKGSVDFSGETWGKVIIEDDVIIGSSVTILSNVTIGKGSIVGAGSVVTKSIPEYCVAYGNPCEVKYFLKDKK